MGKNQWLAFFIASVLLTACQPSEILPKKIYNFESDYVDIQLGDQWEYQLDSIVYDPEPIGIVRDTISQFLLIEAVDSFRNTMGDLVFEIERSVRESDTSKWQLIDVWTMSKTSRELISTEENLSFIKLQFPIDEDSFWDGNALINTEEQEVKVRGETLDFFKFWDNYAVTAIRDTFSFNGITYDDVVEIEHVDREILIEKRVSKEMYAKNVGLIYKKLVILDTQDTSSEPFEQRAEKGFILEMSLIEKR